MAGFEDYFDVALLGQVLEKSVAVLGCSLAFVGTNGTIVVKHGFSEYAEIIEQRAGEDMKMARRIALESAQDMVEYPDGTVALLESVVVDGVEVGALVAGPFTGTLDIAKASAMAGVSLGKLEELTGELVEREEKYQIVTKALARTIFALLRTEKKGTDEIAQLGAVKDVAASVHSLHINDVMQQAVVAMKRVTKARECSIVLENLWYGAGRDEKFRIVERALFASGKRTKSPMLIRNPAQDTLLAGRDVSFLPYSIIVLPLVHANVFVGVLILYVEKEKFDKGKLDLYSLLIEHVSVVVHNALQYVEIQRMASTDGLTGLANRKRFFAYVEDTYGVEKYSIALLDVDDFRHYNNENGHPQGDVLLGELAGVIVGLVGEKGLVARYGGEEFIVALPGVDMADARALLASVRAAVEKHRFTGAEKQPLGRVTVSAGLVVCQDKSVNAVGLVKKADDALYKAKETGKNKVCTSVVLHQGLADVSVE